MLQAQAPTQPGPSANLLGKRAFTALCNGAHCGETRFRDLGEVATSVPAKVTRPSEYTHGPPPVLGGPHGHANEFGLAAPCFQTC